MPSQYNLGQLTTLYNALLVRVNAIDGSGLAQGTLGSVPQLSTNIISIKSDLNQLAANFDDQLTTITSEVNALEAASQGPVGPIGPSAYDVAVSNGFQGSQAQWLTSLEANVQTIGPQGLLIQDVTDGHTYAITCSGGTLTTTLVS